MSIKSKLGGNVKPKYHNEDNPSDKGWLAIIYGVIKLLYNL